MPILNNAFISFQGNKVKNTTKNCPCGGRQHTCKVGRNLYPCLPCRYFKFKHLFRKRNANLCNILRYSYLLQDDWNLYCNPGPFHLCKIIVETLPCGGSGGPSFALNIASNLQIRREETGSGPPQTLFFPFSSKWGCCVKIQHKAGNFQYGGHSMQFLRV